MSDRETPITLVAVQAIQERALAHLQSNIDGSEVGVADAPKAECCVFARYALRLARILNTLGTEGVGTPVVRPEPYICPQCGTPAPDAYIPNGTPSAPAPPAEGAPDELMSAVKQVLDECEGRDAPPSLGAIARLSKAFDVAARAAESPGQ